MKTNEENKPSPYPVPWEIREARANAQIVDERGWPVAMVYSGRKDPDAIATALLLIHAVNSHADLMTCLKAMTTGKQNDPYWQDRAQVAIARAEGGAK